MWLHEFVRSAPAQIEDGAIANCTIVIRIDFRRDARGTDPMGGVKMVE